jgi:hypothetical protein
MSEFLATRRQRRYEPCHIAFDIGKRRIQRLPFGAKDEGDRLTESGHKRFKRGPAATFYEIAIDRVRRDLLRNYAGAFGMISRNRGNKQGKKASVEAPAGKVPYFFAGETVFAGH